MKREETAEETAEKETVPPETETENTAEAQKPDETEALKAEAEDYKRKWYSVTAEYENYRRRTALSKSQAYAEGRADVVKGLFPIADNLDRALSSCAEENTRKGIEMVVKAFLKLLEEEKITVIDPLGKEFDAEKHEAIMAVPPEGGEASGIVKQVYLKGYEQNGKILRFAQVVVTK